MLADRVIKQGQGSRVKGHGENCKEEQGQGSRVKGQGQECKDEGQGSRVKVEEYKDEGQGAGVKGKGEDGVGWLYPAILLLAGLLWGIHPLRVESVVWVSERKDVLNGLFTLGAVFTYLKYAEIREAGANPWKAYLISLTLFACSLMAKPVSVVLPVMLLVIDRFPLERLNRETASRIVLEKAPFLLLSFASALMTFKFGAENRLLISAENLPIAYRFVIAGNALFEYYRLMLVPTGILPLFVLPNPIPYAYAFKAFILFVLTGVVLFRWRKVPAVATTWLLFILPLILVSGLLQNGMQSHAARYTYLPAVPVSIAAAAGLLLLFRNAANRLTPFVRLLPAAIVCLLLFYGGMTWHLTGMWRDTAAFWSRVIDISPDSFPLARYNRGKFLYETGRYEEAVADLSVIIEAEKGEGIPKADNIIALRGEILARMGRYEAARADFDYAISVYPDPAYLKARERLLEDMARFPAGMPPKGENKTAPGRNPGMK
jgi:tetratricopeptide (TPR) repeat protein